MNLQSVVAVQSRMSSIAARFHPLSTPPARTGTGQGGPTFSDALSAAHTQHARRATAAMPAAGELPPAARPWRDHIAATASRHGLDPNLLTALVHQESGFRADARSGAGAIGLTQLMPATARELGVDPTDPLANLDGGARYLRQQLDRFRSVPLALAAYNAGPGRVAASGGIPAISETRRYVANVMAMYARLGGTS